MARCADLGYGYPEVTTHGTGIIMGLVAVRADRYVLDMLLYQGCAVYTLGIYGIDFPMTLPVP